MHMKPAASRVTHIAALWRRLNQPLPGTSPRPEPGSVVWVEGHVSRKTLIKVCGLLLALLLLGIWAAIQGWWQPPRIDPFKPYFAWAKSLVCEEGWVGYSQGMWATLGGIVLFVLLPMWLLWGKFVYDGLQMVRRQTNMPRRGKPWFPFVLRQGQAAVRRGRNMLLWAVPMLCLLLWASYLFADLMHQFLAPPSALKVC